MAEQRFHQDRQLYATEGEAQTVMGSIHKTELKLYILKDWYLSIVLSISGLETFCPQIKMLISVISRNISELW